MAANRSTNLPAPAIIDDAKARRDFVLLHGVLGWGVTTGLVYALVMNATEGDNSPGLAVWLAFSLVAFPLGGIAWGRFMWWHLKRQNAKQPTE